MSAESTDDLFVSDIGSSDDHNEQSSSIGNCSMVDYDIISYLVIF